MVAVAVIGSAVIGAGATAYGASQAASAQGKATRLANQALQQQQAQTRADLLPYNTAGQQAVGQLSNRLGEFTSGIKMDQATLEQTPGYQFNLAQGLKSVQNSAAARGLGVSGAAFKGAAQYATGLADSTYQNQFNNAVTNQTNSYNRLMGLSNLGESAAAQTGALGTQTASNVSNNLTGLGNAQAGAWMAGARGIAGGANQIAGYYVNQQNQQQNPMNLQRSIYG